MGRLFILSAVALMLAGCDANRVYESNIDFKDARWRAADTATFEFSIEDPALKYNVILNVRNSIDFETARLFLNYELRDTSSTALRKRLVEQNLFDKKTGKPFGDSGLGDIYEQHWLLEPNITFPKGRYKVKLSHMMRIDTLTEMLSVGVRVEKAGQE